MKQESTLYVKSCFENGLCEEIDADADLNPVIGLSTRGRTLLPKNKKGGNKKHNLDFGHVS